MNFICSYWGDKYPVEYVNRLYNMVERNYHAPFVFYCQTYKHHGLNPKIELIPFLEELPESTPDAMKESEHYKNNKPVLWDRPKLNYWCPDGWGIKGMKVALDLDVIIQNDLGPLIDLYKDKPITLRSWWHNRKEEKEPAWRKRYGAFNNGSLYMWEDNDATKAIWDDLVENTPKLYHLFHGGSDNFISTRHLDKFDFVPSSMVYSFNRGCEWPDDLEPYLHRPEKILCTFNCDERYDTHYQLHEAYENHPWINDYWK
tara:strand:- start:1656 stop:2429 length:774 start_codon:yes stop_codon:yes gene_type:complete